ncbi:MAG: hypothetical protein VX460_00330, partial [Planctomycetota bacterium]|nr:hypothetical protein [Planctomycetota bacterium]
ASRFMDEDAEELEESLDDGPEDEAVGAALQEGPEPVEEAEEALARALLEPEDAEPEGPDEDEPRPAPDAGGLG